LKFDEINSKSYLELEKIENNIKKIAIDYDNLKISNIQTVSGFQTTLKKEFNSFITYIDDVIDFSDKILGVTEKNKDLNNQFDDYL
jgi:hypothetical protein